MTFFKRLSAYLPPVIFIFIVFGVAGQNAGLADSEFILGRLFSQIDSLANNHDKKQLADSINRYLYKTLERPGTFDYPFTGLNKLGKVRSPDEKIRIYTWNLPLSDGRNCYYGFLQYKKENKKETGLVTLTDRSEEITDPESQILDPGRWYGMLIYDIIAKEYNHRVYYTLLGYDAESLFITCKIADVLYFNEQMEPLFGKPIFNYNNKLLSRILFRYSAKVQMSLKWNEKMKMIVFDHLSPLNSSYEGKYQFYGPDLSFDGLRFEKGIWEWVQDVDVRNN